MSVLKGITPTPAQLASAYREVFDSVIDDAGGKDGRISKASAQKLAKRSDAGALVADNILNFLEKTGQKSVGVAKFQSVVADYVQRQAQRAAGPNQRLSLVEIRNLPADLVGDALHLRGKDDLSVSPTLSFNENDIYDFVTNHFSNPAQTISSGKINHDGAGVVVTDLNDIGPWQPVAEKVLVKLWDKTFKHRAFGGAPIELGPRQSGEILFDEVIDQATNKSGLIVYWKDNDDDSFAWFFEKKDDGSFAELHEVYLN